MIAVLKSYIMEGWFYPKSRKKRKRKKDDFWSDYLRRDNGKIKVLRNRNRREPKYPINDPNIDCSPQTISEIDGDVITENTSDRSQYQSNVFNKIFGKKFEGKTIRTVRRLSSQSETETYHFCLK